MEDGTWRDRLKEEWRKLSKLGWKERFGYIWDYYKPQMAILAGILLLVNIGMTMYRNMQIEEVLQAYLVNCNSMNVDAEAVSQGFADYIGGLEEHQVATVNTTLIEEGKNAPQSQGTMAETMKLTALMSAQAMDLVVLDGLAYGTYLENGFLMDLTEVLSEEQKNRWQDHLVKEEDGTVCAVDVTGSSVLRQQDAYFGGQVYAAVIANSGNVEMSLSFIEYLLDG